MRTESYIEGLYEDPFLGWHLKNKVRRSKRIIPGNKRVGTPKNSDSINGIPYDGKRVIKDSRGLALAIEAIRCSKATQANYISNVPGYARRLELYEALRDRGVDVRTGYILHRPIETIEKRLEESKPEREPSWPSPFSFLFKRHETSTAS